MRTTAHKLLESLEDGKDRVPWEAEGLHEEPPYPLPRPASCPLSGGLGTAGLIFWLKSLWRGKAVVLGDFLGRERPGDGGSVAGGGIC